MSYTQDEYELSCLWFLSGTMYDCGAGSDLEEFCDGGDMAGTGTLPGIWHIISNLKENERRCNNKNESKKDGVKKSWMKKLVKKKQKDAKSTNQDTHANFFCAFCYI